jgi:S1-C subfamily serine protease
MNYSLRGLLSFLSFFSFIVFQIVFQTALASNKPFNPSASVVKIHVTSKSYSEEAPWSSDTSSYIGSGFVIAGKRLVTNAHIIENNTFIEVQLNGDSKRYKASVVAVSHETDLAILALDDQSFFENTKEIELGNLPDVHHEVVVYGYPTGGDALSITEGVISRIEYQTYVHSELGFLAIQVDAAINYGNSGGPAIVDDKVVGVVMQASTEENDMGYLIPISLLKRFLTDISDGKHDNVPDFPIQYQNLESPVLREGYYKLPSDASGVLVTQVCANTQAEGLLQEGDVITKISGDKVENNGKIFKSGNVRFNFLHYIDMHQLGETLVIDIVRKGEEKQIDFPLHDVIELDYVFDQDPRYLIYGGYVFVATKTTAGCLSAEEYKKSTEKDKKDQIRITKVLPSFSSTGTHDVAPMTIDRVNGQAFNSFEDFYCLLSTATTPIILLQDGAGFNLAIDRKVAVNEHKTILERYRIHKSQSIEVDQWEKAESCSKSNL